MKKENITYWDENICASHVNSEASTVINYFKEKGKTEISYIDIGANVGKYYDILSKEFNIKKCVMYEGSKILYDYLSIKFKDFDNIEIFNLIISNENKMWFFNEDTLKYFLNKEDFDGINLGLCSSSNNEQGTLTEMRDINSLLNERFDFFSEFDFIKIDTETVDYLILNSLKDFIKKTNNKPFICFEHNYHSIMDENSAKKIYEKFLSECGYVGEDFKNLCGDVTLKPIETKEQTYNVSNVLKNIVSVNKKVKIKIHNPTNDYTKDYRNYNRFWDELTEHLKLLFDVEENRNFENSHFQSFHVNLKKGISNNFFLLECEYVIENLENGEFVIMSVSDDLTHAILNEKENPFLKKVLVSQFSPKKILNHTNEFFYKYSPWTYFLSTVIDIEPYYEKRIKNGASEDKLYFRGTSLEDRSILNFFDKNLITEFNSIRQDLYYDELIKHKIALSIDGRGEFCYRDIECFGLGVPIIRYEFLSKFYNELIPNFHYISLERPEDMTLYRHGNKYHAQLIEKKYKELLNDLDFLRFISLNAREYYENNLTNKNKILKTINLLNLNDWL